MNRGRLPAPLGAGPGVRQPRPRGSVLAEFLFGLTEQALGLNPPGGGPEPPTPAGRCGLRAGSPREPTLRGRLGHQLGREASALETRQHLGDSRGRCGGAPTNSTPRARGTCAACRPGSPAVEVGDRQGCHRGGSRCTEGRGIPWSPGRCPTARLHTTSSTGRKRGGRGCRPRPAPNSRWRAGASPARGRDRRPAPTRASAGGSGAGPSHRPGPRLRPAEARGARTAGGRRRWRAGWGCPAPRHRGVPRRHRPFERRQGAGEDGRGASRAPNRRSS